MAGREAHRAVTGLGRGHGVMQKMEKEISAALGGELAVPCSLQTAIAGRNSRLRFLASVGEPGEEALSFGSHAMERYEPRQDRKVAAVNNFSMCREVTWKEWNFLGNCP